jgi:uncharacterized protein YuzE
MAKEVLEKKNLDHLLKAVSHLVRLPKSQMRLDYDEDADVLYVHFGDKTTSTHSEMKADGVILDYRGSTLVGITILEASRRGDSSPRYSRRTRVSISRPGRASG